MGLDMYAHRRVYVKQWGSETPEERYTVNLERGGKPVAGIQSKRISSIDEQVMTWRKANHIHAWFVDNVQNGNDDCGEYRVGKDDLRALLSVCQQVIAASELVDGLVYTSTVWKPGKPEPEVQRQPGKVIKGTDVAKKLLPTRAGFFFGSTEYDQEYLNDVVATRDWVMRMLEDHVSGVPGDIYYSSSW